LGDYDGTKLFFAECAGQVFPQWITYLTVSTSHTCNHKWENKLSSTRNSSQILW